MSSHLPQCGAKQAILGKIINLLLQNGLPEEFEGIPIFADFRNMIQVDLILREEGVPDAEKTLASSTRRSPPTWSRRCGGWPSSSPGADRKPEKTAKARRAGRRRPGPLTMTRTRI